MRQYQMVVLSNPVVGREQECEDWYQQEHLQDMVKLPGFTSAQRFRLAHSMEEGNPYQYMAVYKIETDSIDDTMKTLVERAGSGELKVSTALDTQNAYAVVYDSCGDAVVSK